MSEDRFFSCITSLGETVSLLHNCFRLEEDSYCSGYEFADHFIPDNLLAEALKEDGYEDFIYCSDGTVLKVTCKATETPDYVNYVIDPYHMAWDFSLVEEGEDFDFISQEREDKGGNFSTKEVNFKKDLEWIALKSSMSPNDFLTMPNR